MSPRIRISIPCLQKHFIIFLLFGGNFLSSAQTYNSPEIDNKVGTYISQLVSIWNQYNTVDFTEYFQQPVKKKTDSTLLVRNTFLNSNGSKNDLCIQRNLLEQQILRRKSGLELTSSFYRNYRSPVVDPADITSYKYRLTFGVNWDILRGGVYENRVKLKSMKAELEDLKKKQAIERDRLFVSKTSQQIVAFFNEKKNAVLSYRWQLNSEQLPILKQLFMLGQLTSEQYEKAVENETDIKNQMDLYQSFGTISKKIVPTTSSYAFAPLLRINFNKLLSLLPLSPDSIPSNAKQIARYEQDFIKEIRLKAFAGYNYFDVYNSVLPNRSYLSLSVNLDIPLNFSHTQKGELAKLNYQLDFLKNDASPVSHENLVYELLNYYYDYNSRLKQYFNLWAKHKTIENLIKSEKVKQQYQSVEFNPNAAIYLLDDYWSTTINLLDMQYQLYQLLIRINEKIPSSGISDFTEFIDLKPGAPNKESNVCVE